MLKDLLKELSVVILRSLFWDPESVIAIGEVSPMSSNDLCSSLVVNMLSLYKYYNGQQRKADDENHYYENYCLPMQAHTSISYLSHFWLGRKGTERLPASRSLPASASRRPPALYLPGPTQGEPSDSPSWGALSLDSQPNDQASGTASPSAVPRAVRDQLSRLREALAKDLANAEAEISQNESLDEGRLKRLAGARSIAEAQLKSVDAQLHLVNTKMSVLEAAEHMVALEGIVKV